LAQDHEVGLCLEVLCCPDAQKDALR